MRATNRIWDGSEPELAGCKHRGSRTPWLSTAGARSLLCRDCKQELKFSSSVVVNRLTRPQISRPFVQIFPAQPPLRLLRLVGVVLSDAA